MGCDIHLFVERKTANGWEHVPAPDDWNDDALDRSGKPRWRESPKWFSDRNYELFAWLADVRNYHAQSPLAQPRGVPGDASAGVNSENAHWGADGHSHTWYDLAEFSGASFSTKHAGLVREDAYKQWRASGDDFPREWCQGSSVPQVTEAEYKLGERPPLKPGLEWAGFNIYCEWEVASEKSFQRWFKLLRAIREIAGEDSRVVLWFDN